jgi:hypothetical protein
LTGAVEHPGGNGILERRPAGTMGAMTGSTVTTTSVEPRRRPRVGVAAAVVGTVDLLVVALLMLLDRVEVQSEQGLGNVAFGMPLSWVTQDQSLDPPLPYSASFASPWENPTTISWVPLVLNVVIVGLVLAGLWRVVCPLRRDANAVPAPAEGTRQVGGQAHR